MSRILNNPNDVLTAGVSGFASHALSILAEEVRLAKSKSGFDANPLPLPLATLQNVVTQRTPDSARNVVERMVRTGITREEIVDLYIPQVARDLGQAWVDEEMSFATVTIGCARLQGVLRTVGDAWADIRNVEIMGVAMPRFRILVPAEEQHTLGATVLASQLRRYGIVSDLDLQADVFTEEANTAAPAYDAVMISASPRFGFEKLRVFVEKTKASYGNIPVLIGGSILLQNEGVTPQTGADFATNDILKAISLCGLEDKTSTRGDLNLESPTPTRHDTEVALL